MTGGGVARVAPFVALAAACALATPGCGRPRRASPSPVEATSSRVDVFLRCTDAGAREVGFSVRSVELVDAEGTARELAPARRRVSAAEASRRLALAGSIVPPGRYVTLRLVLDGAWLERAGAAQPLELEAADPAGDDALPAPTRAYPLDLDLRLGERDAASVFVDWQAADSLRGGLGFAPSFALSLERPRTTLGTIYVADAGAGAVLAIDRASGQVVGTYKAGAEPRALALARDRRRLCVANAGDGSLSIVDVRQGRVESSVAIAFSARTSDVVLADLERVAAAANPSLDSVSFTTIAPGATVQSVAVGRTPTRLAAAPKLARVFVCESGGDSISVIDVNTRAVVARVPVESRPSDVEVDRDEQELFVGHRTSPNLLVLDARSLALVATVFVGGEVTDVLADPERDRIYVARARPAEIAVVERRLASVVRRIPVSGRIEALAPTPEGGRLFGAAPERGALLSIDLVLGEEEAPIPAGVRPSDVVVAE